MVSSCNATGLHALVEYCKQVDHFSSLGDMCHVTPSNLRRLHPIPDSQNYHP